MKIKLDDVDVQMTTGHTNEVRLSDDMKLILRYPILRDMKNVEGKDDVDKVFNILIKCIHEVHHKEKIYNAVDVTTKDLETFVEQMTTSQLQSIMNFLIVCRNFVM